MKKVVGVRFSANVPRPANEASVFVDAVSAEWEAASVDGLCDKISQVVVHLVGLTNLWDNSRAGVSTRRGEVDRSRRSGVVHRCEVSWPRLPPSVISKSRAAAAHDPPFAGGPPFPFARLTRDRGAR